MNEIAGVQVFNYRGVEFVKIGDMSLGTQAEFSRWLGDRPRPVVHFAYDAAYAEDFKEYHGEESI